MFGAGVLLLALGAMGVAAANLDGNLFGVPAIMDGVSRNVVLLVATAVILAALICVIAVMLAFLLTDRIVKTAISGDPFVAENAKRLMYVGWFLLAAQLIGAGAEIFVGHLPDKLREHIQFSFNASPPGVFTIMLIFALARIFRHGSRMRADLEGTV
jgi:hypothetical protein